MVDGTSMPEDRLRLCNSFVLCYVLVKPTRMSASKLVHSEVGRNVYWYDIFGC